MMKNNGNGQNWKKPKDASKEFSLTTNICSKPLGLQVDKVSSMSGSKVLKEVNNLIESI